MQLNSCDIATIEDAVRYWRACLNMRQQGWSAVDIAIKIVGAWCSDGLDALYGSPSYPEVAMVMEAAADLEVRDEAEGPLFLSVEWAAIQRGVVALEKRLKV